MFFVCYCLSFIVDLVSVPYSYSLKLIWPGNAIGSVLVYRDRHRHSSGVNRQGLGLSQFGCEPTGTGNVTR
jgi:hypothetical protein